MSSDITRDKNMIVQGFKKKGLSKEVMELINYDADYGLTREQIAKYADKKMDIERMRIYSECLRFDYDDRVIKVLTAEGVDITKLKMGLDFYRQGVPIEDVERILSSGEKAIVMKKQYDDILQKTDSLADEAEMEPEYVKKLTDYIEEVVLSIGNTDKKFDEITDVLNNLTQDKKEQKELERILKENQEKDELLSQKQDEINRAYSQAAENRKEAGKLKTENEALKEKVKELQKKYEQDKETFNNVRNDADNYFSFQSANMPYAGNKSAVVRINSNDIERKTSVNNHGLVGIFSRLGIKTKSRRNLVKLVIDGELDRNQLVQIKIAIEKGLTENQLEDIINSRVPAERMKEIIEIAELENGLQGLEADMLSMREMAEWIKKRLEGMSEEEMVFVLEYGMSTGDRELTGNMIEEIKSKDRDFETIKKRYLAIAEKKSLWVKTAESLIASLEMLRIEKEEILHSICSVLNACGVDINRCEIENGNLDKVKEYEGR